jgi:hypothetical protein
MGGLMSRRVDATLSEQDREVLDRWAPGSWRCGAGAEGEQRKETAGHLRCTRQTVGRWRGRFARCGIHRLHDEPRPGRPLKITDEEIERVIVKTLEEQPTDAIHWPTSSDPNWHSYIVPPGQVPRSLHENPSGSQELSAVAAGPGESIAFGAVSISFRDPENPGAKPDSCLFVALAEEVREPVQIARVVFAGGPRLQGRTVEVAAHTRADLRPRHE